MKRKIINKEVIRPAEMICIICEKPTKKLVRDDRGYIKISLGACEEHKDIVKKIMCKLKEKYFSEMDKSIKDMDLFQSNREKYGKNG